MAFIVEDGSEVPNANSYASVAFADSYFTDRGGNTVWDALSTTDKETALVKATDYIDMRFKLMFIGCRKSRDQSLHWPRLNAVQADGWWITSDEVPVDLQKATVEYALQAAQTSELIGKEATSGTASPKIAETVKVGPITVSEKYQDSAAQSRVTGVDVISSSSLSEYPHADLLIQDLLNPSDNLDLWRG